MSSITVSADPALPSWRAHPALNQWVMLALLVSLGLALSPSLPWLTTYPKSWTIPVPQWINALSDAILPLVKPAFRALSAVLDWPMRAIQAALQWLPWPIAMLMVAATALRAGGLKLALFAVATLAYILLAGYWRETVNTLAMVLLAVPLAVLIGFGLGVWGYASPRVRPAINAALDFMQTVPAFAYLIPLLLLFGFGPVVGLLASAIYAAPPMVRNTMLGLELVPDAVKESAVMSGCTPWQRFWQAEVPAARPQLLVGLNQTTNATLSMVIVAAFIGGFSDIGWEVLSSMRKAEFGQSLLSGLVIALLAILIDRITLGFAEVARSGTLHHGRWLAGWRLPGLLAAGLAAAVGVHLVLFDTNLGLPGAEARLGVSVLNAGLNDVVRVHSDSLEALKNTSLYLLMLPLRIGILGCATPAIWGFDLTRAMLAGYCIVSAALAGWLGWRLGWAAAVGVLIAGLFLFFGVSGVPWPVFIAVAALFAWQAAGPGKAVLTAAGLGFILVNGLWEPLTRSLYLVTLAVAICLVVGGALGLWAAQNDRVSKILRPINDALQTMPQFVFLIPALMFFRVGEFTALIAVVLYAIVPPMKYVEHGFRTVPDTVVEAARQMGTSNLQLLTQVKLPLAMPVVMLGVNQTIMAALSMLTIAALVGTRDLGQQVYIALGRADAGQGLVAGLAIALVATISDRTLQAWVLRRQRRAG